MNTVYSSGLEKISTFRLWLLAIVISVLLAETVTAITEILLKGVVTYDYLLTGLVTSVLVAALVVGMVCDFLNRLSEAQQDNANLQSTINDLTLAKHTLQENEEILQTFMDNTNTLIFMKNLKGEYIFVNRRFEELFGISNVNLNGKTDCQMFSEKDANTFSENDQQVISSGEAISVEESVYDAHGVLRTYVCVKFPLRKPSGEIYAICGVATDISVLKQSEDELAKNNKRLNALIEAIPDAIFLKDGDSRWLITNELAKQLFQLNSIPWHGKTEMELADLHPEFRTAHETCLIDDEKTWEAGCLTLFSETVVQEDGSELYFEVRKMPVFDKNGDRQALVIIGRDITERKRAEDQLRIAAATFETHEAIMITDANANIIRVNRAFEKITGYSADEVIGKNPRILKSGQHDRAFYEKMWQSVLSGSWSGEMWDKRKNGIIYPKQVTITAVKNSKGEITQFVSIFNDITSRKLAEEEIKYLAFFDPLTDLPNRRLLQDRLKPALANSHYNLKKGALLFIDMDNFKSINDTLGHDMGDLLLQQVAHRLDSCVRESDTVARFGGDEFVVMLEGLSTKTLEAVAQTEVVAEKILAVLNRPYQLRNYDYHCTPSIGAILFSGHEKSIDELIKQADIAMYQAKNSGRNTLRFFDPQMQATVTARVTMEADLRSALANNQLELYYQLQSTHDRSAIGAEVLLRWHHPQHGMIPPANFIPLAEETGLILEIGHWVLKTACAQIKLWEKNEHTRHLQLAVNVSPKQFRQPEFVEQVSQIIVESGIQPDKLKLELTESLLLDNVTETIQRMHELRGIGVRFSMDDFGTGYSSLAYLTQLPLDQLKIDQSFVRNIGVKPSDAVIVQTIIGMSHNLGIEVIAEGVETEAQRAFLELHNCGLCQGYFFAKPMLLAEFEIVIASAYLDSEIIKRSST